VKSVRQAAEALIKAWETTDDTSLTYEIADLRIALNAQSTHSKDCWRWHLDCAVEKIERDEFNMRRKIHDL